jgi:hypothetical protein
MQWLPYRLLHWNMGRSRPFTEGRPMPLSLISIHIGFFHLIAGLLLIWLIRDVIFNAAVRALTIFFIKPQLK